jgi:hypothetical protein
VSDDILCDRQPFGFSAAKFAGGGAGVVMAGAGAFGIEGALSED